MKKLFVFLLCLSSLGISPNAQEKPLKIGVVVHKTEGFHNAFWDSLQMGARKAGKDFNAEISYLGIPQKYIPNRKVEGQSKIFDDLIDQGYDGIVFTPVDRIRMAEAVKRAVVHNVKVVAIDSPVESNLLSGIIATNNYEASLEATKYIAKLMGGKGSAIMLAHPSRENKATRDREKAFIAGMKEFGPDIKLLSTDRFGGATVDTDYIAAMRLLSEFPQTNAVYCVSGSGIIAFIRALQETGMAGKVILVGWDSDKISLQGLRENTVNGIVQQRPDKMGYEGVRVVIEAIHGTSQRKDLNTGTTLITKENIDSPAIQAIIHPDFTNWIK